MTRRRHIMTANTHAEMTLAERAEVARTLLAVDAIRARRRAVDRQAAAVEALNAR